MRLIDLFEQHFFKVCSFWGDFWGISSAQIRMFFIYATFLTKGSPMILALIAMFLLNLPKYWRQRFHRIYDL